MRVKNNKFIVMLIVAFIFATLNFITNPLGLTRRGVIIAIGYDRSDEGYTMHIQKVVPQGSSANGGSNNYTVISAQGQTVTEALDNVVKKSGAEHSLRHCGVIIFSNEMTEGDVAYIVKQAFVNYELQDNALIVVSESSAYDLLSAKIATTTISETLIDKLVSYDNLRNGVIHTSVRSANVDITSEIPTTVYPIIGRVENNGLIGESSSSGGNNDKTYQLAVIGAKAFSDSHIISFDKNEAEGLSFVMERLNHGAILTDDGEKIIAYNIVNSSAKPKYSLENMSVTYDIKLKVSLAEIKYKNNVSSDKTEIKDNDIKNIENYVTALVLKAFHTARNNDVDILGIYNGMYNHYADKWYDYATDDYLQKIDIKFKYDISITV